MFMAIMTTTKPSHAPALTLTPNIRASIVKSLASMKRKKYIPLGTPQKIVASPVLEAVLRRLDAKHARQSTPENEEGLTKGGNSSPLLDELSHKKG